MPFFFWLVGWLISRFGISAFLWAEPSSFSLLLKAAILDFWGRVPRSTASFELSVAAAFGLMEPGRGMGYLPPNVIVSSHLGTNLVRHHHKAFRFCCWTSSLNCLLEILPPDEIFPVRWRHREKIFRQRDLL